jgi:hypothetical protein
VLRQLLPLGPNRLALPRRGPGDSTVIATVQLKGARLRWLPQSCAVVVLGRALSGRQHGQAGAWWAIHALAHSMVFLSPHIGAGDTVSAGLGMHVHCPLPLRKVRILPSLPGAITVASFATASGAARQRQLYHLLAAGGVRLREGAAPTERAGRCRNGVLALSLGIRW